ncbi:DUF5992 family protein [Pseudoalteromonas denitrificans]|uniref:Uncharacterized protein n=1 Tax=Pseudoalteromonas denitrificans DSM 6059 TaxID=1123010 RepID=A0A1I1S6V0_9GAMM|nr:DUF5992 family protein [Pseudoalteromonas denitrificans]SFD42294.1 hypothetical protein SAMN02745724_04480 [Pseudoalteromonas denitrificans DSM 6059]
MKIKLSFIFSLLLTFNLSAGELIRNAKITQLANTNNNTQDFVIITAGGTGLCAKNSNIISFPKSAYINQSDKAYNQSFAIALAALTSGATIKVHNFNKTSCSEANSISIMKY